MRHHARQARAIAIAERAESPFTLAATLIVPIIAAGLAFFLV